MRSGLSTSPPTENLATEVDFHVESNAGKNDHKKKQLDEESPDIETLVHGFGCRPNVQIWGIQYIGFLAYKFVGMETYYGLQKYLFISHQKWFGLSESSMNANFGWHLTLLFLVRITPGILLIMAAATSKQNFRLMSVLYEVAAAGFTLGDYFSYMYYVANVFPTTKMHPGISVLKVIFDMLEDIGFRAFITFCAWRLYLESLDVLNSISFIKIRQSTSPGLPVCSREGCGCQNDPNYSTKSRHNEDLITVNV